MPDEWGKICLIRLSSLGDLVLMVPMLTALRASFPSSQVHLVCKDRYAELFRESGLVDSIIPVRRGDLRELVELRSALSRARYDAIVDAHGVIRSSLLYHSLSAPAKFRIRKDGQAS